MLLGGFEIPLWVVLGVPACTLLYYYSIRTFDTFKKTGIPGPKPLPVLGTLMEVYEHGHIIHADVARVKKHGNFVGTFIGSAPMLLVADADWLKEAWVKNFKAFTNRRQILFGGSLDQGLFSIEGEHWKHIRQRLSPEFSTGKLKKMMPAIIKCEDRFLEILKKTKGEPIDIRKYILRLTLDVISNTAFGFDAETQTKLENNPFLDAAKTLIEGEETNATRLEKMRLTLAIIMTLLAPRWLTSFAHKYLNLGFVDSNANNYFDKLTESLIEDRKSTEGNDFLQTLTNNLVEAPAGDPDTSISLTGYPWSKKGLTKIEVMGNTILFLSAGFQTTADTMSMIFYELAMNQEEQKKLYEEVTAICVTDEITVEQANQLKYLDYCINETMRLYPQGFRLDRMATEDIEIRGIKVDKGTAVGACVWVMQRSEEYFENPDEFQPERFAPENFTERQASAFMPFGLGNRMCIGNRLALLEMKVTIASVLKGYTMEKTDATPPRPLQFKNGLSLLPKQDMMVSFVERN